MNTNSYRTNNERTVARGNGEYTNVPYNPTITTIAEANGVELRSVERTVGTMYEIRWDDEVLVKYPNLKNAEAFFIDCADITKAKYNKIKAVA